MVTSTVGVEFSIGLSDVSVGISATVPTALTVPVVVEPSGSSTSTAWPTWTSCWRVASRSMVTWRAVPPTVSAGPPAWPPGSAAQAVTRTAAGWTTTSPGAIRPVSSMPSEACQSSTASVVAEVHSWSTVRSSADTTPRATRLASSCSTSTPSSTPGPSSRHIGRSPSSSGTTRSSTSATAWPRSITEPSGGNQVMVPWVASARSWVSP
jgi:hypothetical protein